MSSAVAALAGRTGGVAYRYLMPDSAFPSPITAPQVHADERRRKRRLGQVRFASARQLLRR